MAQKDLIPLNRRTKEEQKRIASAGGKASGEARRRKRSMKDAADLYLSLPVADRRKWNKIAGRGIDPGDVDNQMAIIIGLSDAAAAGDARAAKLLIELLGEAKPDNQQADEGVQIVDDL